MKTIIPVILRRRSPSRRQRKQVSVQADASSAIRRGPSIISVSLAEWLDFDQIKGLFEAPPHRS